MKWAYWACQVAGWGVYTALNLALALATTTSTSPLLLLLSTVGSSAVGLLGSHAVRSYAFQHRWKALGLLQLAPRVLGASVGIGLVWQSWQLFLALFVFRFFTWAQTSLVVFVFLVGQASMMLLLWQVLYFGVHAAQRARRAELDSLASLAAAQTAELRALRTQLNPHFLFNSLNTLRALISEDPAKAQESVTRLSALLRYALSAGEVQTVSLERELDVVKDYLALEVLRFEERLRVVLDVPPDCLSVQVPVMLLQTLVENAVKHGIARCAEGGEVRVSAHKENGVLVIEVSNPGPQAPHPQVAGSGVGLANTKERLRLLFGEAAQFELRATATLTTAHVRVPCP